jgi:hypothetical protein
LKLTSRKFQPVTAYQISIKGEKALKQLLPEDLKQSVDDFYDCDNGNLLSVEWDSEESVFNLVNSSTGEKTASSVTDCEDVSYVSSPWLPLCLRTNITSGVNDLSSNAHRALESNTGTNNIRDDLNEIIHVSDCHLLIGEWIPFGSNQISALNAKLGATERVKGGLFTSIVDDNPEETNFEVDPGLTQVTILDFEVSKYLNFEAEVNFPEEEGIIQIEHFGVHVSEDGFVSYGLFIDAVNDRTAEKVSLDLLSRLLIDVQQDGSKILDSLISSYQRSLLDMIFLGDTLNRDKYSVFIAKDIIPRLTAEQYMDKEDNENELKQVLGDTQAAYNLAEDLILIIGTHGLLFAGSQSGKYEHILASYLSLKTREIFLENFFYKLFSLQSVLHDTRELIINYEKDPNSIPKIRRLLSDTSKDSIMLSETLSYLKESVDHTVDVSEVENDPISNELIKLLAVNAKKKDFLRRVKDLEKNIAGLSHELGTLREMTDVISETQMFKLQEALQSNTKNLEQVFRANERASSSLEILQIILSGTLAFEFLDRLTGGWSVVENTDWGKAYFEPMINTPLLWFMINLLLWAAIGYSLVRIMNYLGQAATGVLSLRMKVNCRISLEKLREYLATKDVKEEDLEIESIGGARVKKLTYEEDDKEKWLGCPPTIEIQFDEVHEYLLKVFMQIDKRAGTLREAAAERIFMQGMRDAGVIVQQSK